jgi:anti-sigma factor ChrR (cupin superfamily)
MKRHEPVLDAELLARLAELQTAMRPPEPVAVRLKANILDQVRHERAAGQPIGERTDSGQLPAPVTLRATEGEWVMLAPKVELKLLREDAFSRSFLLRLHPGAVLPPHEHPLEEECYCLEGEVRFGDLVVRAGDYHLAPRGVPHGPMRSRSGALLFLRGANPG